MKNKVIRFGSFKRMDGNHLTTVYTIDLPRRSIVMNDEGKRRIHFFHSRNGRFNWKQFIANFRFNCYIGANDTLCLLIRNPLFCIEKCPGHLQIGNRFMLHIFKRY